MKFLIFIPPNDFKDESVATIKMFLDRWGVGYQITSYSTKECIGTHGASYRADINTNKVEASEYDGIILVDGAGVEAYKLPEFRPLLDVAMKFNNSKKYVAAIGNATKILARANIIKGKKLALPEDQETKRTVLLFHGVPSEKGFEIDGNIITIKDSSALEESMNPILEHLGVK
ncbi:MAG TPA: DJ-1/PfpI family protein [Candidatus Acidoferrum sp.]|nr:DJ-1/PfpI family protein [Candidatus Acidoferrum sp.]